MNKHRTVRVSLSIEDLFPQATFEKEDFKFQSREVFS